MDIDKNSGLLIPKNYIHSPNQDERPIENDISLIVIHNISLPPNNFCNNNIERFFTNQLNFDEHPYFKTIRDLKVSSHCFIKRDGDLIQFVPFNKRAWHAGKSLFEGRSHCNDFSIGIELEGSDDTRFTKIQYDVLLNLLKTILDTYKTIPSKNIVGHEHIAPDRKTDPGPMFNWKIMKNLA